VEYISEGEIAVLKLMLVEMGSLPPEQISEYRKVNRNFHETIFHISRREYLIRALTQMWEAYPTMLIGNFAETARQPLPQRDEQDQVEHRAIVAALEAHDGQAAGEAMKVHILSAARHLIESLKVNS
jgi:DNA-binding GntR family transcriptional regulator